MILSPGVNRLIVSSKDPEALRLVEQLVDTLTEEPEPGQGEFTIFYLKNSDAEGDRPLDQRSIQRGATVAEDRGASSAAASRGATAFVGSPTPRQTRSSSEPAPSTW